MSGKLIIRVSLPLICTEEPDANVGQLGQPTAQYIQILNVRRLLYCLVAQTIYFSVREPNDPSSNFSHGKT